jgi:hypothetical protein
MRLHREHFCRICDTPCLWCSHCAEAHCFNGHTHEGFDGADPEHRLEEATGG